MKQELRRARGSLPLCGVGIVLFGTWDFGKTVLHSLFAASYVHALLERADIDPEAGKYTATIPQFSERPIMNLGHGRAPAGRQLHPLPVSPRLGKIISAPRRCCTWPSRSANITISERTRPKNHIPCETHSLGVFYISGSPKK